MNYYFIALMVLCTAYALIAGGAPERIAAVLYLLSCCATYLSWLKASRWHEIEFGILFIDVVTFAIFCLIALRADRFGRSGSAPCSGSACSAIWRDRSSLTCSGGPMRCR